MSFKKINESEAISYTKRLLDEYENFNGQCDKIILDSNSVESSRANTGWYRHVDDHHQIFINIPNILRTIKASNLNYQQSYGLLTLCCGHEFRHYQQGKVAYDNEKVYGFDNQDAFNDELIMYIRCFYDAYYLRNKSSIKSEADAELFAILKGYNYLKENFPHSNIEKNMLKAINAYAEIQTSEGIDSPLPEGNKSLTNVINHLCKQVEKNSRVSDLRKTLLVVNPKLENIHLCYGLDESKLFSNDFLNDYAQEKNGTVRDLMVVKKIIASLKYPEESLEQFPIISEKYKNKTL